MIGQNKTGSGGSMGLLLLYFSIALGVSFLCSVMEAVLLSVTPAFIARTQQERPDLGKRLKSLKDDVDKPLAAILSLNTIAHTVGAAGAGAQAARVFGDAFVGVISAVLTFLILVLSEIIPKTLGAVYWRFLTPTIIRLLIPIIWIMWPLVKMAQFLTRLIAPSRKRRLISRDEFLALADLGVREGVMDKQDSRMLKNVFRFSRIQAADIMTPRNVMYALPQHLTVSDVMDGQPESRFSRIPVYRENNDDITGFVLNQDILLAAARGKQNMKLSEMMRPIPVLPETATLERILELLLESRSHIVLAVDECGGTSGIVTLEDLMETLLGLEMLDEGDRITDMREFARTRWLKRARKRGIQLDDSPET